MNKKIISPEPGLRVRHLREGLGLSRRQFEEITGVKAHTLRHIETGTCRLSAPQARVLANMFIYVFRLPEEESSEQFLLHGKHEPQLKKLTLINAES